MDFNDMKVLYRNLRNFEKRMKLINENTKVIANFLYNHDSIEKVYYPSLEGNPYHFLMKKYLKAGSGLISFVLRNSNKENAERFYDNIISPILKGPSLGSEKTLLSPYVIMAHYEDSKEELARLGFGFYLMRLSVGVEPVERIINSLKYALKFVD
jgi:cystathionine beta-lyase/cystathionine gamma-synthase